VVPDRQLLDSDPAADGGAAVTSAADQGLDDRDGVDGTVIGPQRGSCRRCQQLWLELGDPGGVAVLPVTGVVVDGSGFVVSPGQGSSPPHVDSGELPLEPAVVGQHLAAEQELFGRCVDCPPADPGEGVTGGTGSR